MTYGGFDGALVADRDIGTGHYNYYGAAGVWAGGDITGTIAAGRNIGHWDHHYEYSYSGSSGYDIFSYGTINAVITAENPSDSPLGGRIGSVSARESINGLIKASHSIQTVRAGGSVNAGVVAPYIGSIIENDVSLQNMADPELPTSIKDEILAEAAEVYDQVLASRDELADDIEELIEEFAAEKAVALAQLDEYKASVDQILAETSEKLVDAQARELERAETAMGQSAHRSARYLENLRALVERYEDAAINTIASLRAMATQEYEQALADRDQVDQQLAQLDAEMIKLKGQDALAAAAKEKDWDAEMDRIAEAFKEALVATTGNGTSGMVDHIQLFLDVVGFVPG